MNNSNPRKVRGKPAGRKAKRTVRKGQKSESLLDITLDRLKNNPYLAALIIVFVLLNAVLGVFDNALSILPRIVSPQNVEQAARRYAMLLAFSGALVATLYYLTVTIIRFDQDRDENIKDLIAKGGIFEHHIVYEVLPVALCCIFLNFAGFVLNRALGEFFFFDTLGTFLAAFLLGPYWAGVVGLLSNCSMVAVSRNAFVWAVINALLGIAWGFLARRRPNSLSNVLSGFRQPLRRIFLFLIVSLMVSSGASAIIKTSIYDPETIRLYTSNSWIVQKLVLAKLYETKYISLGVAYFLGDIVRNSIDKVLILTMGFLILGARSIGLKRNVDLRKTNATQTHLPLSDRARGSNLVFAGFCIVFLYFVLPFEYVTNRATNVRTLVRLSFSSWLVLALPLYIALLDMIFHPETAIRVKERLSAKHLRSKIYSTRIKKARRTGIVRWVGLGIVSSWLVLLAYFIFLWAISRTSLGAGLDILRTGLSMLAVAVGLTAIIILSFLGWIEKD